MMWNLLTIGPARYCLLADAPGQIGSGLPRSTIETHHLKAKHAVAEAQHAKAALQQGQLTPARQELATSAADLMQLSHQFTSAQQQALEKAKSLIGTTTHPASKAQLQEAANILSQLAQDRVSQLDQAIKALPQQTSNAPVAAGGLKAATQELGRLTHQLGLSPEASRHLQKVFSLEAPNLGVEVALRRAKTMAAYSTMSGNQLVRAVEQAARLYNSASLEAAAYATIQDAGLPGVAAKVQTAGNLVPAAQLNYNAALATLHARGLQIKAPQIQELDPARVADKAREYLYQERMAAASNQGTGAAILAQTQNFNDAFLTGIAKNACGMYQFGANLLASPGQTLSDMATGLYKVARHPVLTSQALLRAWNDASPESKVEIMGQMTTMLATLPIGPASIQGVKQAVVTADAALGSVRAYQATRAAVLTAHATGEAAVAATVSQANVLMLRTLRLTSELQNTTRELAQAAASPAAASRVPTLTRQIAIKTGELKATERQLAQASQTLERQAGSINGPRQTGGGGAAGAADAAYEAIRAGNSDVAAIAQNTGIKASNIQKVKDHIFYKEHLLDRYEKYGVPAEVKRFESDLEMAEAWQRLEAGTYTKADIQLLKHEMAEAWHMEKHGPSYSNAHDAAQRRFPSPLQ